MAATLLREPLCLTDFVAGIAAKTQGTEAALRVYSSCINICTARIYQILIIHAVFEIGNEIYI